MKKTIFLAMGLVFTLTSCFKTKTCTCKDSSGNVRSTRTKKTNNRAEMKSFEDDCKNNAMIETVGNSTTTIPCEIS